MGCRDDEHSCFTVPTGDAGRGRFECRECGIVCQQVVSPWHCLKSGCPYVYSYEGDDTTFFGCLYKVFTPELDLGVFLDKSGRPGRTADPYGPLRVVREPRPQCRVWIERAYEAINPGRACCNPGFLYGLTPRN